MADEVQRLKDEASAREELARRPGPLPVFRTPSPFVYPPQYEDFKRARQRFSHKLEVYAEELREWLAQYSELADERYRTVELLLVVVNGRRGAYAEGVTLAIDLPPGSTSLRRGRPSLRHLTRPPTRRPARVISPRSRGRTLPASGALVFRNRRCRGSRPGK